MPPPPGALGLTPALDPHSAREHLCPPLLPRGSGPNEAIGEAVSLALDRGVEHLDRVRIILIREQGAFRVQHEARRLHFLTHGGRVDPMQRLGVARARPGDGGVIDNDVKPTRLESIIDGTIEAGRSASARSGQDGPGARRLSRSNPVAAAHQNFDASSLRNIILIAPSPPL